MKFKKLKSQSGRSMVEMLGVLAIIGVLSVGGISGYTLSMRRHRANGVADTIAKYSLIVYSQCQKQLLDGDITTITDCSGGPQFSDAGIGSLPAGVREILFSTLDDPKSTGVDVLRTIATFTDPKLCEAVASITNARRSGSPCDYLEIQIKQN